MISRPLTAFVVVACPERANIITKTMMFSDGADAYILSALQFTDYAAPRNRVLPDRVIILSGIYHAQTGPQTLPTLSRELSGAFATIWVRRIVYLTVGFTSQHGTAGIFGWR